MDIELLKEKLQKIASIVKIHEEELDKDGSRFNIFSILKVSSNEVRLHSSFIAELLNIKGTHGYKNQFCKLFIEELKQYDKNNITANFNFDHYEVEVEKSTGLINHDYTMGGRIDILITDNFKNRIIIENKIFAGDQENQLLRYYNYDKSALLLYLTLKGGIPSDWSTNKEILNNEDFHCISYQSFINKWLEKCVEISKDKPKVKETISQYLHIIKNYTEQKENTKMTNEIIKLISESKDLYNSIDEINQSYHLFRQGVNQKFWKVIGEKQPNRTVLVTESGIEIKLFIDEDGDGFYFGFHLEKDNVTIEGTSEEVMHLATIFKGIKPTFNTNATYIGWTYVGEFRRFLMLDKDKIFDLNDDIKMKDFTDPVIIEIDKCISEIKKQIK